MRKKIMILGLCASLLIASMPNGNIKAGSCDLRLYKKTVTMKKGSKTKVRYKASGKIKAKITSGKSVKISVKKKYILIKALKKGKSKIKVSCGRKKACLMVNVKSNKKNKRDDRLIVVQQTPQPTKNPVIKRENAEKIARYSDTINSFCNDMFVSVKNDNENTFVAPFSIYTALALLTNAAADNTRVELSNALGISDMNDFNQCIEEYMKGSLNEDVTFNIANSLWFRKADGVFNKNINKDFTEPMKKSYQAEIRNNLPFDYSTVKSINKWCEEKTNGMIKEVISSLSPEELFVVINALYFKGRWNSVFNESMTKEEIFYGKTKTSKVNMMHMKGNKFNYYKDNNFEAIALLYGQISPSYEMDILMSVDKTKTAGEVFKSLDSKDRLKAFLKFDYSEGNSESKYIKVNNLKLPKFKMECETTMEKIGPFLGTKGIKDAFSPSKARFDAIGSGIYIDSILHKTALEVNEEGSEAAAVTVINMCTSMAPGKMEEEIDFIVDRPFIFCIRDNVSGIILFIGEINDF